MATINDTDPNSNKFFYLTGLSDQFGGGKNTFVVNPTNLIYSGSLISVSVYDSNGNVLPTKVAKPNNSRFGGETMTGTIYVTDINETVKSGIGRIEISSVTLDSGNKTPVLWSRNILIDSTNKTESEVVLFGLPYIDVNAEIHRVPQYPTDSYTLAQGGFSSTAVFPRHNDNGDYQMEFNDTIYQINRTSGAPFSFSMEGEKIRLKNVVVQVFTYTNNTIGSLKYSGPLNTDFIAPIKRVINDSSILLSIPFRTVADILNLTNQDSEYSKNNLVNIEGVTPESDPTKQTSYYKKNFYVLSLSQGSFEVIYKNIPTDVPQYMDTGSIGLKRSFINIEFRDIRALGGSVSTYKIFGKSLNTPQTRTLISEGRVDANEAMISTNFNNGYYNSPGNFYSPSYLSRFWLSNGSVSFYQDNSILINGAHISHTGNSTQTDYVIFKDDAIEPSRNSTYSSPNLINESYWYGKSSIFNNTIDYPNTSFHEAGTISPFNSFVYSQENLLSGTAHNSNPIKLVSNCLYNFSMRVRSGANNTSNSYLYAYFISGDEVTKIGTIDSSFRFGANEQYSNSFFVSNTKYGTIKLVPVSGEWYISNISIKPYQTNSFSPDYFAIKIPINNVVRNELFEIEAELYDSSDKLCYGSNSYTFAYNNVYGLLKKQVYVDPDGVTIRVGSGGGPIGPSGSQGPSGTFPNSGSYVVTASGALTSQTASYALTASYTQTSVATNAISASYVPTASYVLSASYSLSSSYSSMGQITITGSKYSRLMKKISGSITSPITQTAWVSPDAFNVKDYGAVGDGTTNDTTALQTCLIDAANNHGVYFIPSGTYKITSSLILPTGFTGSLRIMGAGRRVSTIMQTTNGANGFYFDLSTGSNGLPGGDAYRNSIDISDIGILIDENVVGGSALTINYGSSSFISVENVITAMIRGVYINQKNSGYGGITGGWKNGLVLVQSWHSIIQDFYALGNVLSYTSGSGGGSGYAIDIQGGVNIEMSNIGTEWWSKGIVVRDAIGSQDFVQGIVLNNWIAVECVECLHIYGVIGEYMGSFWFNNCVLDNGNGHLGNHACVVLDNLDTFNMTDSHLLNAGSASYFADAVVVVNNCSKVSFSGTDFISAWCNYAVRFNGSSYSSVTNCNLEAGDVAQIYLDYSSHDNKICDNTKGTNIHIFDNSNNGDGGGNNFIGKSYGKTTMKTVPAMPTYSFMVDIGPAAYAFKPAAGQVSMASSLGSYPIIGGYDFDNVGNNYTSAYFNIWRTDGANLPATPIRFSVNVYP